MTSFVPHTVASLRPVFPPKPNGHCWWAQCFRKKKCPSSISPSGQFLFKGAVTHFLSDDSPLWGEQNYVESSDLLCFQDLKGHGRFSLSFLRASHVHNNGLCWSFLLDPKIKSTKVGVFQHLKHICMGGRGNNEDSRMQRRAEEEKG